ncbi:MAG TPA: glycosyltransferase [Cyclobacteriaceae bacterium]|nr:glycosyltransferase [Cyclobacteriaceae bacterium]
MRICIARSQKNAYSETFIRDQIKGLAERSEVFPIHTGRLPERDAEGKLLMPFPFWIMHKVVKTLTGERNNFFINYGLKRFLVKKKIDVVLANYGLTGAHLVPICERADVPLVVIFHGYDATQRWVLKKYKHHYKRLFSYAKSIVAVSNEMKNKLIREGAPEEKISVISCGINLDQFYPSDKKSSVPLFVAVGRFKEKKSPQTTIKAFHQVYLKHPKARLVMIGGKNDLYYKCVELTRALNIQEAVQFTGILPPSTIAEWLKKAHVFVQHSVTASNGDMEGTPVGILEACATGLPVVSTLHGGIKDAIVHGKTGFLVPEHDEEGTARYMEYLIENPSVAVEMGKAAREHIRQHYDSSTQIARLYNLLCKAAGKIDSQAVSAVISER